jgi:hypothetical protein
MPLMVRHFGSRERPPVVAACSGGCIRDLLRLEARGLDEPVGVTLICRNAAGCGTRPASTLALHVSSMVPSGWHRAWACRGRSSRGHCGREVGFDLLGLGQSDERQRTCLQDGAEGEGHLIAAMRHTRRR